MTRFLWKGPALEKHGAKVGWEHFCFLLKEGGLGIKRVHDWNKAATLKHMWRIVSHEQSIWPTWVNTVLLKGRSIWEIKAPGCISWTWRKILQSRTWCKGLFVSQIGNGADTSLWYDHWLPDGSSLREKLPHRTLAITRLPWNARVDKIIQDGNWAFPPSAQDLQQVWNSIAFQPNMNERDCVIWNGHSSGKFSIASAWNHIRKKKRQHPLYDLMWFPGHVPRYALTLWIASMGRLATLDRPQMRGVSSSRQCVLCDEEAESHEHLFFSCPYSTTVWHQIKVQTQIHWPTKRWKHLLLWGRRKFSTKNKATNFIAKQTLATTVYFLWTERNGRIFQNNFKPARLLSHEVITQVRLLLLDFKHHIPVHIKTRWNV